MRRNQLQLFELPARPRAPRQWRMHVIDAGYGDDRHHHLVRMACQRCGHETDWFVVRTVTEGKAGKPCPLCNGINTPGE